MVPADEAIGSSGVSSTTHPDYLVGNTPLEIELEPDEYWVTVLKMDDPIDFRADGEDDTVFRVYLDAQGQMTGAVTAGKSYLITKTVGRQVMVTALFWPKDQPLTDFVASLPEENVLGFTDEGSVWEKLLTDILQTHSIPPEDQPYLVQMLNKTGKLVWYSPDSSRHLYVYFNEPTQVVVDPNVPLPAESAHPPQTAAAAIVASTAADQMNLALSAPVEFYIPDDNQGPWQLTPEQLREMLVIEQTVQADGTSADQVSVNLDQARAFLDSLAPDLTVSPVNARFVFNDETRQLEVIEHSVNGRSLEMESTLAQFEPALLATDPADRRVRLVFQELIPTVNDQATASALGIFELVVQRTTYYDDARRTNIQVAAENFHGLIIPPNEEFSFNEWLGDVSVEAEYEQGLIIVGNQVITGVDGGVCQVATTAFQTAFYGGYPILERVEHAFRASSFEEVEGPGMDAAVYAPVADFRFLNDTPYHLLIEVDVNPDDSSITWKFYSTSMNRRVVKEGPFIRNEVSPPPPIYRANPELDGGQAQQVSYAASGADVDVYRTVYEGDRVIIDREEYHSHYVPWASEFEVAPGDSRING